MDRIAWLLFDYTALFSNVLMENDQFTLRYLCQFNSYLHSVVVHIVLERGHSIFHGKAANLAKIQFVAFIEILDNVYITLV